MSTISSTIHFHLHNLSPYNYMSSKQNLFHRTMDKFKLSIKPLPIESRRKAIKCAQLQEEKCIFQLDSITIGSPLYEEIIALFFKLFQIVRYGNLIRTIWFNISTFPEPFQNQHREIEYMSLLSMSPGK